MYTAREYDKEIWLYYYRARYYSTELWRFINRDPVWQSDQVNMYTYIGNNPLMGVDPSGKVKQFFKGIVEWAVKWDYIKDPTFGNIIWQIWFWFTPAWWAWDVRDISYQWNHWTKTDIFFAWFGLIPWIWDWAKGIYKWIKKWEKLLGKVWIDVVKEVGEVGKVWNDAVKWESKFKIIFDFDKHAKDSMLARWWTEAKIDDVVNNWNYLFTKKAIDKSTNDPATAFYISKNQYVVVNDKTWRVVQVSKLSDNNWNYINWETYVFISCNKSIEIVNKILSDKSLDLNKVYVNFNPCDFDYYMKL